MSKTSERLDNYITQMQEQADQHSMILASDVLDMLEQLQDDLKDAIEKVVEELEKLKNTGSVTKTEMLITKACVNRAIDIVRRGGVE